VTVESPGLARQAFKAARAAGNGFADHLIAQVAFANGADQIITFDQKFARSAKVRLLK
jgi:predicted nucleic-acid-binding protein